MKILLNAASGRNQREAVLPKLKELLTATPTIGTAERAPDEIVPFESGEELVREAKSAANGPDEIVVAGGGDGTVSCVAGKLAGTDKTLGVLPLGTYNNFARDLGMPLELEPALEALRDGNAIEVDLAEVNGETFINNSSIGLYPHVVRKREQLQEETGRPKWFAQISALFFLLRRFPSVAVTLKIDGRTLHRRTPVVFIGNNLYEADRVALGRRTRLDAGKLCVFVAHPRGAWHLMRLLFRAAMGRLHPDKDLEKFITDELEIQARTPYLIVSRDGEVSRMQTPLRYRIRPRALRVIVPRAR